MITIDDANTVFIHLKFRKKKILNCCELSVSAHVIVLDARIFRMLVMTLSQSQPSSTSFLGVSQCTVTFRLTLLTIKSIKYIRDHKFCLIMFHDDGRKVKNNLRKFDVKVINRMRNISGFFKE